ncbi:type III secretion system stator protein SctL [Paraburkholderia nemoris]|uniref:type III secretion system stator protein SctL n=1 Tax=Paraburkholderia nemoris TaxID=2793076 RepID=UPI0038BB959B
MAIWLKSDPKAVAIDADVVRAEEFARVTELSDALEALHELVAATMCDATTRAQALVETARREADAFVAGARRKFDNSARLGYAAGHRRALADTHARYLASMRSEQQQLHGSAERLSRLVMKVVEQVIAESDRDALMRRVVLTVTRAIDDAAHLSVTVSPVDAERAKRLFSEIGQTAVPPLNLDVIVNDQAIAGTCICEWDDGVVEANLGAQIAGLARALARGAASAVSSASLDSGDWNERNAGTYDGDEPLADERGSYGEDQ